MQGQQHDRGMTALTFVSYFHTSTVFGRRREGKRISLVTMTARCFFIMVQGSDYRCGRFTLTNLRERNLGIVPAGGCLE